MKINRMYAISRGDYMNKKKLYIADFNCTFGEENYPLLEYFEEIVYPAFTLNALSVIFIVSPPPIFFSIIR